jgi:hypothetical protein
MKAKLPQILSLAALAFAISSIEAQAGKIYLGVGAASVTNANAAYVQTRLKIDNTNWDAMLGNGYQPIAPGTFAQRDIGNTGSISGQTFRYEVVNLVGQGLYFTLDKTPLTAPVDFSLAYGTFNSGSVPAAGSSTSAATLLGAGGLQVAPQTNFYNALHLYSQATASGSSVSFANVSFSVSDPSIELNGAFPLSGMANNTTPMVDSYLAYFNDNGTKGDLSSVGWSFSADVTITGNNSKEGAKFELTGRTLDYTPPASSVAAVPETSTWVMGFLALGAVIFVVRRNSTVSA